MSDYFKENYERWYGWFSNIYDPFTRCMFFFSNGGFGGERRIRQAVISALEPEPGERIFDLGSGTGTLAIMIGEELGGGGEVAGVEMSRSQLRVATRKPRPGGVTFVEGDARRTGFPTGSFDKGVIFGVLHELPHDVRMDMLGEARRLLKPGGTLVSVEHNVPRKKWLAVLQDLSERLNPEYRTYRDLMERGLDTEIVDAGFTIVRQETLVHEMARLVLARDPGDGRP